MAYSGCLVWSSLCFCMLHLPNLTKAISRHASNKQSAHHRVQTTECTPQSAHHKMYHSPGPDAGRNLAGAFRISHPAYDLSHTQDANLFRTTLPEVHTMKLCGPTLLLYSKNIVLIQDIEDAISCGVTSVRLLTSNT